MQITRIYTNRKLFSSSYIKCVNSMSSLAAFQTKQCIGRISFYAAKLAYITGLSFICTSNEKMKAVQIVEKKF